MGDGIRDMQGHAKGILGLGPGADGVFEVEYTTPVGTSQGSGQHVATLIYKASRVVPTGAVNLPRSWGALACAYLGVPATA